LGSGRFERHKRFEQFAGFHLFARFGRVEADWIETSRGFAGGRLGTRQREAQDCHAPADGDRSGYGDTSGRDRPLHSGAETNT
jgi:hypothetical protein